MYIKLDLSDEKDVNIDLDNFCQNEANNLEYNCEIDTCRKLRAFGTREQPKSGFLCETECEDGRLL